MRCRLSLALVLLVAGAATAQPPTYSRWTGNNAITPVQGNYNFGTPLELTWGFVPDGTAINDSTSNATSNLQARLNTIYGSQATWQPLFASTFDRWASVSGLSYRYEANDDGVGLATTRGVLGTRADVRIGGKTIDGNSGTLAYNYFPNNADMVIDTADNYFSNSSGTANNSRGLRNVVTHEHGHGIGMPHLESSNARFLMEPFIDTSFDGPQYHDILAAQHQYGDAREKGAGGQNNNVAARATQLGTVSAGSAASVGGSARTLAVAFTATDFVSVSSSSDADFYKFTVDAAGRFTIRLESLGFTYNATPQGSGGAAPFDTKSRSDLILALFGSDGTTLVRSANDTGLGGDESFGIDLDPGDYYARVTGTNNPDLIALDTQFYALTVIAPVPEPATVFLAVAGGFWLLHRRRA